MTKLAWVRLPRRCQQSELCRDRSAPARKMRGPPVGMTTKEESPAEGIGRVCGIRNQRPGTL